jgi:PAS domain S-box-containing protein
VSKTRTRRSSALAAWLAAVDPDSLWRGYALALGVTFVAASVNWVLTAETGARGPLMTYMLAVMVVAWYGHKGGALLSLLVSIVATVVLSLDVPGAAEHDSAYGIFALGLFVATSIAAVYALSRVKLARERERAAKQAYRASQIRLEGALEAGRLVSWEWELGTGRVKCSASAVKVFGTDIQHVDEVWKFVHPADAEHVKATVAKALACQNEYSMLNRMLRADTGALRWIETRALVHRSESGKPTHITAFTSDVTEKQQALESLKVSEQRKDEFLATLAHELRNPLAPIRYAAKLLNPDAPADTQAKASEIIERQATQMARLLDDLLDMSRVTRNVIELRREVFDLRRVVEDAVTGAKPLIEGLHHELQVTLAGEPLWVNADVTRVRQILDNLLQNAAKYTDPGGHIEVHAALERGSAVLAVRDTGIGLAPDALHRVFDLFTQVQPAGRGRTGLGIGLAVVKRLVELHGGSIAVQSAGPGKGARFTVKLPLCESPQRVAAESEAKIVRLFNSQARVLVVDDNPDVVESLSMLLRNHGYPVHTATDGDSAIRLAEALQPEVALLDLGMPKVDGYQVASWIRRQSWGGSVRLVAITGWGQEADRQRTQAAGFDAHLVKPVDSNELLRLLHADRPTQHEISQTGA